jgi:hypothetical protein
MQIKTIQEGYNSGRAYYIRTESSSCQQNMGKLKTLSRSARIRAEKRTRFEHNQLQVHRCIPRCPRSPLAVRGRSRGPRAEERVNTCDRDKG